MSHFGQARLVNFETKTCKPSDQIWLTKIGLAKPLLTSKTGPVGPVLPGLSFFNGHLSCADCPIG